MRTGLAARTWADFRSHWREALGFHVLIQLLGLAIFTPMTTWIGRRLVQASGEPVISNFDIASFVLSPIGAFGILLFVALTVSLLLAEFAGLSYVAERAVARRGVSLARRSTSCCASCRSSPCCPRGSSCDSCCSPCPS